MIRQIALFAVVGLCATATHVIVGYVLIGLSIGPYSANTVGFVTAFCVSYFGHAVFTFNIRREAARDSLLRYICLAALGYALHQPLFMVLTSFAKIEPIFAMFVASIVVACFTFVAARILVFRS